MNRNDFSISAGTMWSLNVVWVLDFTQTGNHYSKSLATRVDDTFDFVNIGALNIRVRDS